MSLEQASDAVITFLDPPTEDQWRLIQGVIDDEQWHVAHWNYFLILHKLPYAKAVVSTDKQGKYVGILIFVQPPNHCVSYVGIYIVSKSCRGKGIGERMWKLMKENTDKSRVLVIDSQLAMTAKYRSVDFSVPGPTWQKMTGSVAQLNSALEQAVHELDSHVKIVDSKTVIEEIAQLDSDIMHYDRSPFIRAFYSVAEGKAILADDGSVRSVGAIFPTYLEKTQIRIGPLLGENLNDILMLLSVLLRDVEQTEFFITVPAESESGRKLISFFTEKAHANLGPLLERSFDRPYEYSTDWEKIYSLTCHIGAPLT